MLLNNSAESYEKCRQLSYVLKLILLTLMYDIFCHCSTFLGKQGK